MDGIVVEGEYKWSNTDCAVQMPAKPRIGASKDEINPARAFDTNLAHQKIMIDTESLLEAFKYELSNYPPSLFNNGQMRDPGKAKFANYLCDTWGKDSLVTEDTLQDPLIVYDGGMLLLHLVHLWIKEKTFGEIADGYVSHLVRKTRDTLEILVLFDGYRWHYNKGTLAASEKSSQISRLCCYKRSQTGYPRKRIPQQSG